MNTNNTPAPFRSIELEMPVTGVTETTNDGKRFAVDHVCFLAWVDDGRFYQVTYAHGESSCCRVGGDWVPTPPPEWLALADMLRKSVQS